MLPPSSFTSDSFFGSFMLRPNPAEPWCSSGSGFSARISSRFFRCHGFGALLILVSGAFSARSPWSTSLSFSLPTLSACTRTHSVSSAIYHLHLCFSAERACGWPHFGSADYGPCAKTFPQKSRAALLSHNSLACPSKIAWSSGARCSSLPVLLSCWRSTTLYGTHRRQHWCCTDRPQRYSARICC